MNTEFVSFPISDFQRIKQQVLNWANQFNTCCFLDNNEYKSEHSSYECIAGIGALDLVTSNAGNALQLLSAFQEKYSNDWMFGHLAYDLKNGIEQLSSSHPDYISFPDLFFFIPRIIIQLNDSELSICSNNSLPASDIFSTICNTELLTPANSQPSLVIESRFTKQEYIDTVLQLQQHILRGDCYEINFCQEFFTNNTGNLDALQLYHSLVAASPTPFAAFYKLENKYLLCASPERYLKKEGTKIISQPIKGTGKRNLTDSAIDKLNKQELYNSAKDRSENIMVVDLVRNDLSRICAEGTVSVDELFGIYSFPQVHQMISTITGQLKPGLSFADIIHAVFPMGSMTGAPKRKVLQLIEQYEKTRRGIFSGALGYISPRGDFDFNVVIRSILYNEISQYLSYLVGSGITFYSNAEEEYEECILKATAIKKVLAVPTPS